MRHAAVLQAITHMGGWHAVATELKLADVKDTDKAWQAWSIQDLSHELRLFMDPHNSSPGAATTPAAAVDAAGHQNAASRAAGGQQQPQQQQQQHKQQQQQPADAGCSSRLSGFVRRRRHRHLQQAEPPSELQAQQRQQPIPAAHLPTQAELVSAGRLDIVYSLRRHGYDAVRQHMGLKARYSRPKQKVRCVMVRCTMQKGQCAVAFQPAVTVTQGLYSGTGSACINGRCKHSLQS